MADTISRAAIVTGTGSGIGKATAKRLAQDGWAVTLNGLRPEKLEQTATEIGAPDRTLIAAGDVSNPVDFDAMFRAHLKKFGRLDALVNNAGVYAWGPIDQLDFSEWRKVMSVNADAHFHTISRAVPLLENTGGCIVNVSSVSGLGGDWGMSPYNASKGAVSNFTRALALDLAERGIRVNAVAPSLTETELTEGMLDDEHMMAMFRQRIPMGRAAKPEEIADVIAFLVSHDARFVNGVILPVDGGLTASNGQPHFV
jgi:meso-butanediol dehydrogenase/(S,S)-butanediol dehydrogenase/diacetyl reductase